MKTFSFQRTIGLLGAILAVIAVSACASTAPLDTHSVTGSTGGGELRFVAELPPPDTLNGGEQPIAANDVLDIDVFQVESLNRTVQVDAEGNISLPLIGSVPASGSTVRQLERTIETAYGTNYLQSPDVTIFVKESMGQRITVDGEVSRAGIYPVTSNSTLIDLIAQANGLRSIADQRQIYVYRDHAGQKLVANYDLHAIRSGRRPNPRVYGGDLIVVFASGTKVAMANLREVLGLASRVAGVAALP